MTTVLLNIENFEYLKNLARERNPEIGSSHLTEALAAGLGFNKHASLLESLKHSTSRLHAVAYSNSEFEKRLKHLREKSNKTKAKIEFDPLQFNQQDLPISTWQLHQSDAVYYKYSRLNLPIIFIKNEKRKYCKLDYDYHFARMPEVKTFDFEIAKNKAVKQLLSEFQRIARSLDMPKAVFEGSIVTGWVTDVPIIKFDAFANSFARVYFNTIRAVETEMETKHFL